MEPSNLIPKRNESLRLNITATTGFSCLFLHFNLTEAEKNHGSAVLMLLMYDAIKIKYRIECLIRQNSENFYRVIKAENPHGFCIGIESDAVADENGALAVVDSAFKNVLKFNKNKINEEDLNKLSGADVNKAKSLAAKLRKDIFQENSYDFHIEHWEI